MNEYRLENLSEKIQKGMSIMNVPGATVAVVKDGEVIYSEAFGYADMSGKVKMKKDHILPIGSASKPFTATAAMMLVAEGKLDLDKPVRDYIPEFELSDPYVSSHVTTRDLLCHRTGLPRHDLMWINWDNLNRHDLVTNRIKHLSFNKPFRSEWQYQNHMFAVVGYLVERISGMTWEKFLKERIFKPLNINRVSYKMEADESHVKLYSENLEGVNKENKPLLIDAMGPAGSINSTAEDMAKWVLFNLNRGKVGDDCIVKEEIFSELQKPNIPYKLLPFGFTEKVGLGYGLGWFIDSFRGVKLVEHGGNVIGGSAHIAMLPDKNIGCVVLTNANNSLFGTALSNYIFDRLLGIDEEKDWFTAYHEGMTSLLKQMKAVLKEVYNTKVDGTKYSHELKEYEGKYENGGYGDITITFDGEALHLKYHDNDDLALKHLHYDVFTMELMESPLPVSFKTGFKGNIEAIYIPFEGSVDPIEFKKIN